MDLNDRRRSIYMYLSGGLKHRVGVALALEFIIDRRLQAKKSRKNENEVRTL